MSYNYFANVYDILTKNVEYKHRADYICSLLSENGINGGLLLDLACGTGNMSVELSEKGYNVIGVDLSEDMLSVAQNKMYERGQNILFLCQDMRKLDLYGTIDSAVCTLDAINHLTNEKDVEATFKKVSLFMNGGGIFIFDVNTPYKHQKVLADNSFTYDFDDVLCEWKNTLKKDNMTVNINLDFTVNEANGKTLRFNENFNEKAYEPELLSKLLEKADFSVLAQYNELTKDKPTDTTERIVFVARRNNR